MVKRIIEGKTYNTETATMVAEEKYNDLELELFRWNKLFQTRHGAYFLYMGDERFPDSERVEPLSPAEAQAWMEKHTSTELIEQHFGEMPEAGESESRYTLRMPDSLKQRIDIAAKEKNQSTNAWVIRCLERCLNAQMHKGDSLEQN